MATIPQEYIQQGVQQGLDQGLEQGLEKSILRILRRRFGELPPEVQAKLAGLTAPELDALLDEALVAASLPQFMAR